MSQNIFYNKEIKFYIFIFLVKFQLLDYIFLMYSCETWKLYTFRYNCIKSLYYCLSQTGNHTSEQTITSDVIKHRRWN